MPALPVEAVDTTAAGDAFCGALADALARGTGVLDATVWAVARRGARDDPPRRAAVAADAGRGRGRRADRDGAARV